MDVEGDIVCGVDLVLGAADVEVLAQALHRDQRPGGLPLRCGRVREAGRTLPLQGEDAPAVVVRGRRKEVADGAGFDDFAVLHDDHAVAIVGDDAQVLRDQQHGRASAVRRLPHLIEELRLDRDVEAAGRLVRNQEPRAGAHGHGDKHALGHACGELVGIGFHPPLGVVDADELQHLDGPGVRGLAAYAVVRKVDVLDLAADRQHGMERGARALHDQADVLAADRIELRIVHGQHVAPEIVHLARDDAAGWAHQAHHANRRR